MAEDSRDVAATNEKSGGNAALKGIKAVAKFCLDNWLVFGFGIATLLAYFFPSQFVSIVGNLGIASANATFV